MYYWSGEIELWLHLILINFNLSSIMCNSSALAYLVLKCHFYLQEFLKQIKDPLRDKIINSRVLLCSFLQEPTQLMDSFIYLFTIGIERVCRNDHFSSLFFQRDRLKKENMRSLEVGGRTSQYFTYLTSITQEFIEFLF